MSDFEEFCKSRYQDLKDEWMRDTLDQYPSKEAWEADWAVNEPSESEWIEENKEDLEQEYIEGKRAAAAEFAWECAGER